MSIRSEVTAWLAQSKQADYRRIVGNDKYDDNPASHYSWDSSVVHHQEVGVGDVIVIWDEYLLGVSVIDRIETGTGTKTTSKCPHCGRSNVVSRKHKLPVFRCDDCRAEFDEPVYGKKNVTTYRGSHDQAWIDLEGVLDGKSLRSLCVYPREQNSFRKLKFEEFRRALRSATDGDPLRILDETIEQLSAQSAGNTRVGPVRVRTARASMRAQLLAEYGPRCAVTGPAPEAVLEACRLDIYSVPGKSVDQGGLLMRRDIHKLFDMGLLVVDGAGIVDIAEDIRAYPAYEALHGSRVDIEFDSKQSEWLRLHQEQWRSR